MRPDRNTVKKRARMIQGTVGVVCVAMLAFVLGWAIKNAVTGFGGGAEEIKTAEPSSSAADISNTDSAASETGSAPDGSAVQDDAAAQNDAASQTTTVTTAALSEQTAPEVTTTRTNYTGWMTEDTPGQQQGGQTDVTPVNQFPESADIADYFTDAVFIGNSLTVGLSMNCGKPLATFYASTGLNVNTVWDSATIALDNGSYGTVFDALAQKQFSRVYVMFGINEVGWPYWDVFRTNYAKVVDKIKELQPGAKIYIESILPVSSKAVETDPVFTTDKIDGLNEYVKNVAADTGTTYLDVNSALRQADGSLPEEASTDGIHLMKDYCMNWLKYLADHK